MLGNNPAVPIMVFVLEHLHQPALPPWGDWGCIAPALLFFHMGLTKEPRAPHQKGEVIYLCLKKDVLYYTASEMLGLTDCHLL